MPRPRANTREYLTTICGTIELRKARTIVDTMQGKHSRFDTVVDYITDAVARQIARDWPAVQKAIGKATPPTP